MISQSDFIQIRPYLYVECINDFKLCFNIVGGEILTFPDTSTTQGLSLWCFNIVAESTRPGYAESNHESNIFLIPTHYGDITLFYAPGGDSAISD